MDGAEPGLGAMIYGYDDADAETIRKFLRGVIGSDVSIISGSGRERDKVGDIIEQESSLTFQAGNTRILMFLGFDDGQIGDVLGSFPGDLPRPIFCGLTENNVGWPLSELIEHLLEEQRYWSGKGK